jgi:hypothetical protein
VNVLYPPLHLIFKVKGGCHGPGLGREREGSMFELFSVIFRR